MNELKSSSYSEEWNYSGMVAETKSTVELTATFMIQNQPNLSQT